MLYSELSIFVAPLQTSQFALVQPVATAAPSRENQAHAPRAPLLPPRRQSLTVREPEQRRHCLSDDFCIEASRKVADADLAIQTAILREELVCSHGRLNNATVHLDCPLLFQECASAGGCVWRTPPWRTFP